MGTLIDRLEANYRPGIEAIATRNVHYELDPLTGAPLFHTGAPMFQPPSMMNPLPHSGGVNLPGSGLDLHFKGDCQIGRFKPFGSESSMHSPVLNSYESAMADLYAQNLGLRRY